MWPVSVGWTCDQHGRRAGSGAVEKIVNWPSLSTLREIRSFLAAAAYFRVLIQSFQMIAKPLYGVLRADGLATDGGPSSELLFRH